MAVGQHIRELCVGPLSPGAVALHASRAHHGGLPEGPRGARQELPRLRPRSEPVREVQQQHP